MEDESPLYGNDEVEIKGTSQDEYEEGLLENQINNQSSENRSGISWYKASFLVINAALGAGLLNFPQAFSETGGIVAGNLTHIIFVACALGSLIILAICASEKNCKTYQEVVRHYCGPKWSVVSSICITIYCFITCVTFIIIIGDQFDRAFASFYGTDFCYHWYMNRKFTMVVSSLLLIFPCCFKRIDGMEFMSYVGVLSIIYLVIVITVELSTGQYAKGDIVILDFHLTKFFNALPTICFGYQCHVSSVPIFSCLKKRGKSAALKASVTAIVSCFVVYTISANCGYLTFGSMINSDILLDYDAKKIYVLVAVILLAVKSWTTYPILLFCVREAVSDLYLGLMGFDHIEAAANEPVRRKVIASVLWIASILFAVFIPSLNVVIRLLGSLAGVFILIFPGMCFLNKILESSSTVVSISGRLKETQITMAVWFILLGVFAFGLASCLGIEGLVNPIAEHPICVTRGFIAMVPYTGNH